MKTKTQRCSKDRAKPSKIKRSKPDTVNQPVRTAHTFVHHYKSTQYCNTETVFFSIFQYSPSSRPTSHLWCGQVENVHLSLRNGCILYMYNNFFKYRFVFLRHALTAHSIAYKKESWTHSKCFEEISTTYGAIFHFFTSQLNASIKLNDFWYV